MEPLLGLNTFMCVKCLAVVGAQELRPHSWETGFMAHQIQANCFLLQMGKPRRSREENGPGGPGDLPQNPIIEAMSLELKQIPVKSLS